MKNGLLSLVIPEKERQRSGVRRRMNVLRWQSAAAQATDECKGEITYGESDP